MMSKPKGPEAQNRCFLSYSTEHQHHAKFLKDEIENACAVEVFVASDPSSLSPGDDWYAKLLATLGESKATLLLVSHSSVNRPWLLFESGGAVAFGHKLIPLLFGGLRPTLLPGPLARLQSCDLSQRDVVIAMLKQLPSTRVPQRVSLNKRAKSIVDYFRAVEEKQAETAVTERPLPSLDYRTTVLSKASETQRKLFFYVRTHEFEGKKKGVLESRIREELPVAYEHDERHGSTRGKRRQTRDLAISASEYYYRLRDLYHLGVLEMAKVSEFENRWSLNSEVRDRLR
jgi:TIR domain